MSRMRRSRPAPRADRRGRAGGRSAKKTRALSLAIVGAGRAGSALAVALSQCGWRIEAVAARRLGRARALARLCGAPLVSTDASLAALAADAVLLAVPDRELPVLARALAAPRGAARGEKKRGERRAGARIVLHTSGANDASVLAPLRARGWAIGSFHPLLSFPRPGSARSVTVDAGARAKPGPPSLFDGAAIAIDGDPAARRLARSLAGSLGARPLAIPAPERARYHLAACFAANYVVTLVWEATRLLAEAGVSPRQTLPALLPLVRSTVGNLERSGLPDALTGPVARGDDATVARHAALVRRGDRRLRALHRRLVETTARLAREAGVIDRTAQQRIERALGR